jgi:hypothetical protein
MLDIYAMTNEQGIIKTEDIEAPRVTQECYKVCAELEKKLRNFKSR